MAQTAEELRLELRDKREAVGRDLEEIGDKVSPKRIADRAGSRVKNAAISVKDKVMGSAEDAADSASDVAGRASSRVGDLKDRVGETPELIRTKTEGNPIAAGLIAFGFGLLAASLIPSSDKEKELVERAEDQLQQVAATAGDMAGTVKEELQESGQSVVADLRESAEQHVQNVKEQASDAAEQVTDHAKDQVADTAEQITSGDDTEAFPATTPSTAAQPVPHTATTGAPGYVETMGVPVDPESTTTRAFPGA